MAAIGCLPSCGSGTSIFTISTVAELKYMLSTIWSIKDKNGLHTYLAASLLHKNAVLLATDLSHLKGMFAYEILERIREESLSLTQAKLRAVALGLEMHVGEDSDGTADITFSDCPYSKEDLIGKLMIFEPLDFVWN